jgi:mRNA-degrading endonuclease RelE of RelBE toxin-antitoxin system
MAYVELARRAIRDLRHLGPGTHQRQLRAAIDALASDAAHLDVKPLEGHAPWLRLRDGDYRLLYRPLRPDELRARPGSLDAGYLIARVIHRRELERAVSTLP